MAIRTISDTGGNYSITTTWVENVVPTLSDDVVATATSGPLTINLSGSARSIDLSNYNNTITLNAIWQILGANTTNNLGTGTWSGTTLPNNTGAIRFLGTNQTITGTTASRPIWNLSFSSNSILNLGSDIYVRDVGQMNGGAAIKTISGYNFFVSGNVGIAESNGILNGSAITIGGTTKWNLIGSGIISTGTILSTFEINSTSSVGYRTIGNGILIGNGGTFSIIQGSFSSDSTVFLSNTATGQTFNLDIRQPINVCVNDTNTTAYTGAGGTVTINASNLNINKLYAMQFFQTSTTATTGSKTIRIIGCGLSASELIFIPKSFNSSATTLVETKNFIANTFVLNSDFAHTIGRIKGSGGSEQTTTGTFTKTNPFLRSLTASQVATINLGNASAVNDINLLDINFTGNKMYTLGGTISNCTNALNTFNVGWGYAG